MSVDPEDNSEPIIRDKRRIDPETGDVREPAAAEESAAAGEPIVDELSDADRAVLDEAEADLVAEYRDRAARAEAELANFRARVERDRGANRDAVIAEVLRAMLPALDDLARAKKHGDLEEGSPLALVASKIDSGFEKFGLNIVGVAGEPFDPAMHEAVAPIPSAEVEVETVADVIEPGYRIHERVVRPAKVAVFVPTSAS